MTSKLRGHVFSELSYYIAKWFTPTIILLFLYIIIRLLITEEIDGVTICAVVFLTLLDISIIILRSKVLKNLSLSFLCEESMITNHSDYGNCIVDLRKSFYVCQITKPGVPRGYPVAEHFYMLSNAPITYVSDWEENQIKVILSLVKKGVAIIPINQDTTTWLIDYLININVPIYPKVAYIPQAGDRLHERF